MNDIRVGELNSENENILKSRIVSPDDHNYPHNALHLYAENESVNIHNLSMLAKSPHNTATIQCIDAFQRNFYDAQKNSLKQMK